MGGAAYTEKDLEGLRVGHDADEFDTGEEVVLTLKDSKILDGEDDELHNVNLSEDVKSREALELKRKGRQAGRYTGLDDDEFEGAAGARRGGVGQIQGDDRRQGGEELSDWERGLRARGRTRGWRWIR